MYSNSIKQYWAKVRDYFVLLCIRLIYLKQHIKLLCSTNLQQLFNDVNWVKRQQVILHRLGVKKIDLFIRQENNTLCKKEFDFPVLLFFHVS